MKRIFFAFMMLMFVPVIALCSTATVPDQEIDLNPQGWIAGGTLKFKPGSQVELNERGDVISGVLKFDEYLRSIGKGYDNHGLSDSQRPTPSNFLFFKGYNSIIIFDEHGRVISGTLAGSSYIYLIPDTDPCIKFKGDTVIVFDKNGNLKTGTINEDYYLRPLGGNNFLPSNAEFIKFKAGTEVVFGANAKVVKGTIANDLTINGITYSAGTPLQFSESANPQKI